jgi:lipoate-protein ligase A
VGDRKISGNAQARRGKALLVHGTLLVDFDHDLADAVLKYPPREPAYRLGRPHRDFLVTLRSLGVKADRASIERAAFDVARQVFGPIQRLYGEAVKQQAANRKGIPCGLLS